MERDPKETAKSMYLDIWKNRDIQLDEALKICISVVDKVLDATPERIFKPGFIGEDINPDHVFWTKVRHELKKQTHG